MYLGPVTQYQKSYSTLGLMRIIAVQRHTYQCDHCGTVVCVCGVAEEDFYCPQCVVKEVGIRPAASAPAPSTDTGAR